MDELYKLKFNKSKATIGFVLFGSTVVLKGDCM